MTLTNTSNDISYAEVENWKTNYKMIEKYMKSISNSDQLSFMREYKELAKREILQLER